MEMQVVIWSGVSRYPDAEEGAYLVAYGEREADVGKEGDKEGC